MGFLSLPKMRECEEIYILMILCFCLLEGILMYVSVVSTRPRKQLAYV